MAHVLFVRISSELDPEEFDRRLLERRPRCSTERSRSSRMVR
jgi:hypothetical protein